MFQFNRNNLITSTALIIAIVVGFCLSLNHNNYVMAQTFDNLEDNHNLPLTSVWDRSTVSYDGNHKITVYRSPSCSCCAGWIKHMQKHGFEIAEIKTIEMETIKQKYNLPQELTSCHTAIIDGYILEGHVPADDLKRLLTQKPNIIKGLTVPAMPIGTPGMESGNVKQPFSVIAFDAQGETAVFNRYDNY